MELKVGDRVKLKLMKNLGDYSDPELFPDNPHFDHDMMEYIGQELTLAKKEVGEYDFSIEEDDGNYFWDARWFEPIRDIKANPITYEELLEK